MPLLTSASLPAQAACGKTLMAEELVQYFASHRHKLGPAQAKLNYDKVIQVKR